MSSSSALSTPSNIAVLNVFDIASLSYNRRNVPCCYDAARGACVRTDAAAFSTTWQQNNDSGATDDSTSAFAGGSTAICCNNPAAAGGAVTTRASANRSDAWRPHLSKRPVHHLVQRGTRPALLHLRHRVVVRRARELLPRCVEAARRVDVRGTCDARIRRREIRRRQDGISTRRGDQGLSVGHLAGLSESETRRTASPVPDHHSDCSRHSEIVQAFRLASARRRSRPSA